MTSQSPLTFTRLAVLGLIAAAAFGLSACGKKATAVAAGEATEGSPTAKVTVIEYASVACPICAHVNETVMPEFKAKYVDTGKVQYVYRPMMTGNPSVAAAGHLLAQCAGKEKYFTVVDSIMRAQKEMDAGGPPEQYVNARDVLVRIAGSAGLSQSEFEACVTNPKEIQRLQDLNEQYLRKDGITGTPTFFVNGKKLEGTPQDIKFFDNAIQPQLK
ncbi:MAG: DsbA family protein [Asticcacaulis sp.]|nr:DsbA family protein [Asticcacaulis sp.]